jgi:Ca-activated chloride channel homolog
MDWESPQYAWWLPVSAVILVLSFWRTQLSWPRPRLWAQFIARAALITAVIAALAHPRWKISSEKKAVVCIIDVSQSVSPAAATAALAQVQQWQTQWGSSVPVGLILAGHEPRIIRTLDPAEATPWPTAASLTTLSAELSHRSSLAAACRVAESLFPPGVSRHVILMSDGLQTHGDLTAWARSAALSGLTLHTQGMTSGPQADVSLRELTASQSSAPEGATIALTARWSSGLSGPATVRLFENNLEVAQASINLQPGQSGETSFDRLATTGPQMQFRAVIEPTAADIHPDNNTAHTLISVASQPKILHLEGEADQAHFLRSAMAAEGITLESRSTEALPRTREALASYDAVLISDVPAHRLPEAWMQLLSDYVRDGGGLIMSGGPQSFGVGGYYRTPLEDIMPVKLESPDEEEEVSSALALVIDRSGSMQGEKLQFCQAAALATATLLRKKDFLGIYAFDSQAYEVYRMSAVSEDKMSRLSETIAALAPGGGTNIYPGMVMARTALNEVPAKIKHMIVLTDGQTGGQNYDTLTSSIRAEGITVSTVAVGTDAAQALLQEMAEIGGGQFYLTQDPSSITRIFAQDTMRHTGRLIREKVFTPQVIEDHPMLTRWPAAQAPPLRGYVKTLRRATAPVLMATDIGDPLLAFWHVGAGKVTAFTSDAKNRWATAWVSGWPGFTTLWSQIIRETARPAQSQRLRLQWETSPLALTATLWDKDDRPLSGLPVQAQLSFLPENSASTGALPVNLSLPLSPAGAGFYRALIPEDTESRRGLWSARVTAESEWSQSFLAQNLITEDTSGRIDQSLLDEAARLTGGTSLPPAASAPLLTARVTDRTIDLRPWCLAAVLLFALIDLLIRRWEHVLGLSDAVREKFTPAAS